MTLIEQKEVEEKRAWQQYRTLQIKILVAKELVNLCILEYDAWKLADTIDIDMGAGLIARLEREGATEKELKKIVYYLKEFQEKVYPGLKFS